MEKAKRSGFSTVWALPTATASYASPTHVQQQNQSLRSASRSVETLLAATPPGVSNDPPRFYQPGGLSVAGSNLYVADTNNGLIRVIDLDEKTVKTLEIHGFEASHASQAESHLPKAKLATLEKSPVAPGQELTLT